MQNFEVIDHMVFVAIGEALRDAIAFTPIRFENANLFICAAGMWVQF